MFRWLLAIVLAALALRRLAGALPGTRPAPRRPFPPDEPRDRANSRAGEGLSPHAIEDAEYEEIPGGRP